MEKRWGNMMLMKYSWAVLRQKADQCDLMHMERAVALANPGSTVARIFFVESWNWDHRVTKGHLSCTKNVPKDF